MRAMYEVSALPAYQDNYIWTLSRGSAAVVVDPGDAAPVLAWLERRGLRLAAILVTHHHWDHVDGIEPLLARHPAPVYGPAGEAIPGRTQALREGDRVELPELELSLEVFDVPGHTAGHIAYFGSGMLFCGDTLFAGGCGRLFEGTPVQMHASLSKLAALPPDTRVYCTHEYTAANLSFASAVEPQNQALQQRLRDVQALRARGQITLPSTIAEELRTNPFLRTGERSVIEGAEAHSGKPLSSPVEVFAAVRAWKDNA